MKTDLIQIGFVSGELAPALLARIDLDQYKTGAKKILNAYSLPHGGVIRRPGTYFDDTLKTQNQKGRLFPFVYSKLAAYVLVFNDGKIQFISNDAFIESSPGVRYEITSPYSESELPDITYSQQGSVLFLCHPNYPPKQLVRITDTNWSLSDIVFDYYALTDRNFESEYVNFKILSGTTAFDTTSKFVFTTDGLGNVVETQPISLTSGTGNGKLSAASATISTDIPSKWTIQCITSVSSGGTLRQEWSVVRGGVGYQDVNVGGNKTGAAATGLANDATAYTADVVIDGVTKNVSIVGSTAQTYTTLLAEINTDIGAAGTAVIVSGNIRIRSSTTGTSSTVAITNTGANPLFSTLTGYVGIISAVAGTADLEPVAQWSPGNYPAAVGFFQQRVWFAGTPNHPQKMWGSKIAEDEILTLGPESNDAVTLQIAGDTFDQIGFLDGGKVLSIFSYGGEYLATGNATSGIAPSIAVIERQTKHGSTNVKPLRVAAEILFVQRDRKIVRSVAYQATTDSYVAPDITILAEHITANGVLDMSFAQDPDNVVWLITQAGELLSLTLLREQGITAWTAHSTGLSGEFESICTIPTPLGKDKTYVIVKRTVGGNTKRFIEFIDYETVVGGISGNTLDCSLAGASVTAKTTWTGMDHLEGETISVVYDGKVHRDVTVSGGAFTLDYPANTVVAGLNYITEVELLHPELPGGVESTRAKSLRVRKVILLLKDTINTSVTLHDAVGNEKGTIPIPFFKGGDPTDTAPIPFTGQVDLTGEGWITPYNLSIKQVTPLPWTLLGVIMRVETNDGSAKGD